MILQPKDTTVAYRCPECGSTIFSVVGALALSGDIIKLKCTCGCSELIMEKAEDEKIRITVPCIFCPSPHHYVVSRKLLTSRELFTFPCAYAGVDILFVGAKGEVMKAVEVSDKELRSMIDDTELAGVHEANAGDELCVDEHMRDMVLFVLGDLAEEKRIHCKCEDGKGDFLVETTADGICISCKKCGAAKDICCDGISLETQAFLDCTDLYLETEKN